MTGKRKAITKKIRFEIFKRDSFTCQYCGSMAPDVILEIDHINPVANGGENDILNLITSCKDCNSGKGKRTLNENQTLKQQQKQLKEINQRREQLTLMVKWKEELDEFEDEQVTIIENILISGARTRFNDFGKKECKKDIQKFGFELVYESTKKSINQYLVINDDGTVNKESAQKIFNYIPKICQGTINQQNNPMLIKSKYIYAIIRNRFGIYSEKRIRKALSESVICQDSYDLVCHIAKTCNNWSNFFNELNNNFEGEW